MNRPRPLLGFAVVRGRSMEPTLRDGDRVLVGWGMRARLGSPAVVRLPPGPDGPRPVAVKRVTAHTSQGWWVERDNPVDGVDSWLVGAVPDGDVLGRVLLRLPRLPRFVRRAGRA